MISDSMRDAIAYQANREFYSAYLYLSMSAWFSAGGLPGCATWMRVQADEEQEHGEKMYDYLVAEGARVELFEIEKPPAEWESAVAVFQHVQAHESLVTGLIEKLAALAEEEDDAVTRAFLQWYLDEQVEEEESAGKALAGAQAALVGGSMGSFDAAMGERTGHGR